MEKNMTQGTPWKHILWFSLPILGGMILQSLYSTVDGIVVGNFVGEEALGAMNTSISYANVLLAISTGLSTGCGIVIAQFFGGDRRDRLRLCISTMLILMVGLGLAVAVVGIATATLVLKYVLGVPEDVLPYALTYIRIYFLGMVFQFAYNAMAAELRSVGDSKATMLFLLISSAVNILLDLLLVIVCGLGVAGVAVGTVLAQLVSVLVSMVYIKRRHTLLWVSRHEMIFRAELCGTILKVGIPVMLQTMISSLGMLAIQRLINSFGSATMAGVAGASKIENYAIMPIIAFASGMSTYAGQNAGAGDLKRVWKGYVSGLILTGLICGAFSLVIFALAQPLVSLFGCTGDALSFGVEYLRFMACVLVIMTMLFISRGMLQGVGDVTITTVITFATLALRIILAYWMAGLPAVGRKAIYICMGIDFCIGAVFYIIRLASGTWKQKILVKTAKKS